MEYAEGVKENLSADELQGRLLLRHNHLTNLYSNDGKSFTCPKVSFDVAMIMLINASTETSYPIIISNKVRFGRTEINMPILTW